jgi:predicted nucleic acid-binding OB-fold protein
MKTKVKLGMGCKPKIQKTKRQNLKRGKGLRFHDLTRTARSALKGKKFKNSSDPIKITRCC